MDRGSLGALMRSSLAAATDVHAELAASCVEPLLDAAFAIARSIDGGGKVLLFGNGGSAADAQHVAAEFVGRFVKDRRPLPAIALTTDTSALTAISNDYGYDQVFSRQVSALASKDDVVISISTSGRSANVISALRAAKELGATTISFTGGGISPSSEIADIGIVVPATSTSRIQECHLTLEHVLCESVEVLLGCSEQEVDSGGPRDTGAASADFHDKVVPFPELLEERRVWAQQGKEVVWTNGCFDLVHVGHVESLWQASRLGDVLVVGINDDASTRRLKGADRPIVAAANRALLVAAFGFVDRVVTFSEDTPEKVLGMLRPDVHCKAADYAPPDGKPIPEAAVVESYGGRVEFVPLLGDHSSSSLIAKAASPSSSGSSG